jgi:hypothetical protein
MDLLNLDDKQFAQAPRESFVDPDMYVMDPAKGQQGVYKGVGRFLPWWKDPNGSKYRKNVVMLTNPLSKDRLVVDCPSTISQPSVLWALDKMLKDREKNNVDIDLVKEIRESFSRFLNFYSPFYIYKDMQQSALENQIKILNFGITIDKLIQKELNPEDADLNPNAKKINPYSLTEGKDFLFVVKKKSKRYKDYDDCKFLADVVPFRFMIGAEKHVVTREELVQMSQGVETPLSKFLQANTPNMDKYKYREWTEDTYKQVALYLKAIISYQGFMRELIDGTREEKMKQMLIDATSGLTYGTTLQNQTPAQTNIAPETMTQNQAQAQVPAAQAPAAQAPATQAPAQGIDLTGSAPAQAPAQVQTPTAQTPSPQTEIPVGQQTPPQPQQGVKLDEDDQFSKMLNAL